MNHKNTLRGRILLLGMIIVSIYLAGCNLSLKDNSDSGSSIPTDKKYPAAVMIGTGADDSRDTVINTSAPFPSRKTLYFSVRSFGGFGVKELYAEVTDSNVTGDEKQKKVVYSCTVPVERGRHNVLGTIPSLMPGEYEITIYRFSEDIAVRRFRIE